jgi:glycosyltransferase involved in cell wall biosynthesis
MKPHVQLSLIMPVYNEEALLEHSVTLTIAVAEQLGLTYEVIIINDGSTDRTKEITERLHQRHPGIVRTAHNKTNRRMGGALLRGFRLARAEWCLFSPIDNPLSASQMRQFVHAATQADIVVGYRSRRVGYSLWMRLASGIYWRLLRMCFGTRLRDLTWIAMYRRSIFTQINPRFRWVTFFPEVILKAERLGLRIVEVRCDMRPRAQGKGTVSRPHVILQALIDTLRLWWELLWFKK